jgi:CRP/FNR family transcriptional regulator
MRVGHARFDDRIFDETSCGSANSTIRTGPLTLLLRAQKMIRFASKQIIFHEDDPADAVFLFASGTVGQYRFLPNGRRLVAGFLFPGDFAGLSFGERYSLTAQSIAPTAAYSLPRAELNVLCNHSTALQTDLVCLLKQELVSEREAHLPMLHQAAHARVARLLLMLPRRKGIDGGNGEAVQLTMTRSDIADYLGISVETVCRSFTKLKEDRLIASSSPDRIWIKNMARLSSLGEGQE